MNATMHVSGLRSCNVRTCVNTCISKSLFQVLYSSPVVLNSLESYILSENAWYIMVVYKHLAVL